MFRVLSNKEKIDLTMSKHFKPNQFFIIFQEYLLSSISKANLSDSRKTFPFIFFGSFDEKNKRCTLFVYNVNNSFKQVSDADPESIISISVIVLTYSLVLIRA